MPNTVIIVKENEKSSIIKAIENDCKVFVESADESNKKSEFTAIHEHALQLYKVLDGCGLLEIKSQIEKIDVMAIQQDKEGINCEIILTKLFLNSIELICV